ncbi:dTDP-4-amino-4,6-dideoxygalactose transaminase [Clostridium homopropionicum DSM 5847]|uniref:dTDP-4-amino-4,6-dideoxygalactose transaminase n=1 Tax=Clostridium homopropionicum DSM 5847 TaxID=1121318 RepID=A0A0L6Z7M8_9CLOT|nr:dTDP-4-amino-4,6-dideoxygalactose transaminase [Clostridium homopropionicum]KOA18969.1 dTDP-4-amino-4,6-dideoxygalactose transaminase [Clostridium homopropionicum DSM 5847]SFG43116.1 dTDP-4-amino-4,6-dideoxygalactose transaminase [Clostridium homopropionicum]
MKIPYNRLYFSGNEIQYISDAIEKESLCGDGYYTKIVTNFLEKSFSINKVLMTTSATHALEMASMLIGLKSGDEVLMPSFTFPSTANSVMLQGAKPVFCEINKATFNIDVNDIQAKITPRTKAILPVHYGGISCEMDEILEIAKLYHLYVIEDAAQGVNSKYKNKYLGSLGHIGCYSFHSTKNYICGEGGALTINTNNKDILERAETLRQKGTDRHKFIKGDVDKYSWVDLGSSYVPSDILMAILYSQLENLNLIKEKRKIIHEFYIDKLQRHVNRGFIQGLTYVPEYSSPNYHLFYIVFSTKEIRDSALKGLKKYNINALTHFVPLHSSPMGIKLGYTPNSLPLTENLANCLLRLPIYTSMTLEEATFVVESLNKVIKEL